MRKLVFVLLAAHVVFPILWIVLLARNGPLQNDWWHFRVAAEQFVSGQWSALYSLEMESIHPGYFWRYPPFLLYAVAPLAWLSPSAAYGVIAGVGAGALALAMRILARWGRIQPVAPWALAILLSAPALTTFITGQISGILLLLIVAAAMLWGAGRVVAACALLGLLAIKPNLGVFFGLFVIARGEWRGALAMVAVVAALCATTIPLGTDLWTDFFRVSSSNTQALPPYEPHKLVTLRGFLTSLFGETNAVFALWAVAATGLVLAAAWTWRVSSWSMGALATVVLLALAANPYGFFYDALLLAFPATIWWVERDVWRPASWLFVGVLIGVAWVAEHVSHSWALIFLLFGREIAPPFSLVGPVTAVWLVVALSELRRPRQVVDARQA